MSRPRDALVAYAVVRFRRPQTQKRSPAGSADPRATREACGIQALSCDVEQDARDHRCSAFDDEAAAGTSAVLGVVSRKRSRRRSLVAGSGSGSPRAVLTPSSGRGVGGACGYSRGVPALRTSPSAGSGVDAGPVGGLAQSQNTSFGSRNLGVRDGFTRSAADGIRPHARVPNGYMRIRETHQPRPAPKPNRP
jgi:hypothetical protein